MESQANRDEDLFRPPFSPEPKCLHHERSLGWRHARDGIHRRRAEPTRVQRYRLAERQKMNRERLEAAHGRPEPQATRDQVETLLRRVTGGPCSFKLVSDEHRAYVQAAKRMKGWTIEHERISSKAPRTHRNPLWPANLADLLVRHGGANHERETIAFSKRVQNALLRMAIFQVDRNFVQGRRVRDGKRSPSPAMLRGVATRRLEVGEVLAERLFPSRVRLTEDLREVYEERVATRQIANPRRHELRYAA